MCITSVAIHVTIHSEASPGRKPLRHALAEMFQRFPHVRLHSLYGNAECLCYLRILESLNATHLEDNARTLWEVFHRFAQRNVDLAFFDTRVSCWTER